MTSSGRSLSLFIHAPWTFVVHVLHLVLEKAAAIDGVPFGIQSCQKAFPILIVTSQISGSSR
jgi:hypothetical protein